MQRFYDATETNLRVYSSMTNETVRVYAEVL